MGWRFQLHCWRLVLGCVLLIIPLWLPVTSIVVWVFPGMVGMVIATSPIRAIVF